MRLARLRLGACLVVALVVALVCSVQQATALSSGLVISQVYGGGGNTGATLKNDFIELFNRGSTPVDVGGWSVQYASATGSTWQVTTLSGTIAPGHYYLVKEAAGAGGTVDLPTPDATGTIAMSATNGKVGLVNSTSALSGTCPLGSAVVDFIGYVATPTTGTCFEGSGPAPALNSTTADLRGLNGCMETDNNATDFSQSAPNPRNSLASAHFCDGDQAPSVSSTMPAPNASDVARDSNVTITFSEPVSVSGDGYSISCASTGPHPATLTGGPVSYTLDPASDFGLNETCTVTVAAAGVTDTDENDPPNNMAADDVWSFTTVAPTYRIHDIQCAAHLSPLAGQRTSGVAGVVTAVRSNGLWMQDPIPDANEATSEAIFVFTSSRPTVLTGQAVHVSGLITEFRPGGASADNLTTTEIEQAIVTPAGPGAAIAPTVVGTGGRVPPGAVIEDDANATGNVEKSGDLDPSQDGIEFYESLEAMLLRVNDAVAVGPTNSFGEVFVVGDNGANAGPRTSRGGVVIAPLDFNPERIQLDDVLADTPDVHVGDRIPGATVGVLSYDFGNFELLPLAPVVAGSGGLAREVTQVTRGNELSIATFNVENLDPSDVPTIPRLARIVVDNMRSPDLIGIEEMQDNTGGANDGTTAANLSWQAFIDAIVAAGGPRYEYRQIDPQNNADGGQPGGNIRVGFRFRTDRGLTFVDRGAGDAMTPTGVFRQDGKAHLTLSPGRVDPASPAWEATRKPLAGEFVWNDKTLIVIVNHFSSKGGDDPLFGRIQPPIRSSEVARHPQAASVNAFVDSILAAEEKANLVVLGDINDFEFSETTRILVDGGVLTSLVNTLPKAERYSYVFEGNSQVLDQILFSANMLRGLVAYDVVHVNAEFFDQASDHDPSVARAKVLGGGGGEG
ncbi:endonuclease/exonuclease/phosphatase family protein [soil metagenome]